MLDNVKGSARWYDHLFSLAYSRADYIDFSSAISLLYSWNKSHVVIIHNYFYIQLDLPCYQSNSPMQDYFFPSLIYQTTFLFLLILLFDNFWLWCSLLQISLIFILLGIRLISCIWLLCLSVTVSVILPKALCCSFSCEIHGDDMNILSHMTLRLSSFSVFQIHLF